MKVVDVICFLLLGVIVVGAGFMFYFLHCDLTYGNWRGPFLQAESTELPWTGEHKPINRNQTCNFLSYENDGFASVLRVADGHVLVRYRTPRSEEELLDNECPNYTQTVITMATYNNWVNRMETIKEQEEAERRATLRLQEMERQLTN